MSFWDQVKQKLAVFFSKAGSAMQRFMYGRHGADQLSLHLLVLGIALYLMAMLTGFFPLALVSVGLYIYSAFRMLSKNHLKRTNENTKYLSAYYKTKQRGQQSVMRFKNRKEYKYFRCPGCKTLMRLPRNKGVVTVTCKCCHTSFTQKA